jgi:pimeloyl-ACP methyl ester carboxylesterase
VLLGPGVRVLNLGGLGNADVLLVPRIGGALAVVKDFAPRSAALRLIAPLLVRHELAMLRRLEGLPGIPRPLGRVGRLALAMEYVEGVPLRGRWLGNGLPPTFFDALEGILVGMGERGVAYLDLRSPTNVLRTPAGSPALVDLGSAYAVPLPRALRRWHDRRALAKLRARFQGSRPLALEAAAREPQPLKLGRMRFRIVDAGRARDPVPVVLLPDAGFSVDVFRPQLDTALAAGRRALVIELPGAAPGSRPRRGLSLPACARALERLLAALRLPSFDLVGLGRGGLVAAHLACAAPSLVRRLVTIDAPFNGAPRAAGSDAGAGIGDGRERVRAALPDELAAEDRREILALLPHTPERALVRALTWLPPSARPGQPWLVVRRDRSEPPPEGPSAEGTAVVWKRPLGDPERLWRALEPTEGFAAVDDPAD